jgi:hypothetical protein
MGTWKQMNNGRRGTNENEKKRGNEKKEGS